MRFNTFNGFFCCRMQSLFAQRVVERAGESPARGGVWKMISVCVSETACWLGRERKVNPPINTMMGARKWWKCDENRWTNKYLRSIEGGSRERGEENEAETRKKIKLVFYYLWCRLWFKKEAVRALEKLENIDFPRGLRQFNSPRVEENQLHVHTRPEHEHVLMELDLGDGWWRQWVSHRNESQVLDECRSIAITIVVRVVINSSF